MSSFNLFGLPGNKQEYIQNKVAEVPANRALKL